MSDKIKKHSPLKKEPLRQAGESLDNRLRELFFEKIMAIVLILSFMFYMFLYDLSRLYYNNTPQPMFWLLIGVLLILLFYKRLLKYWQEAKNTSLGTRGEKIVGEMLSGLRKDGYEIFHDLITEKGNIDHIIVGPPGVFTIETKTISKTKGDQRITYDGKNIKIDGFISNKDYLLQANGEKAWLESFIEQNIGKAINVKVKPVIIYPGWFIDPSCKNAEVLIFNDNEKCLPVQLQKMEKTLDRDQIDILSNLIGNYIRKKEEEF